MSGVLRERVATIRQRARSAADRRYAAAVISRSLRDLGYEVEEGFDTLFVKGGEAYCHKPSLGAYAVRVRAESGTRNLHFEVVRAGGEVRGGSPGDDDVSTRERQARDRTAQAEWCSDYGRLAAAASEEGIRWDTLNNLPPGAVRVPVVASARTRRRDRETEARGGADTRERTLRR